MERVAVLHVDSAVRATLRALVDARGHSVVEVSTLEALSDAADHAPVALVIVDVTTLRALGLEALQVAALGGRPLAHVPVILSAERGSAALADVSHEAVDELLWEPIDARELGLRVDSGLARRRTTELVAVASHELRSPIHAIVAFLDLLGRSGLPDDQREMVAGARTASRHLLDLVEDLLEHARLSQGPVALGSSAFSLRDVVREAIAIAVEAARPDHVPVAVTYADGLPDAFRGDGPRVRQILINLVSNALKFGTNEPVRVAVRRDGGTLELEVVDDGPGVPESARAFLFEPFRQVDASVPRRFGGTGLGLAIARSLSRRMGGDVRVLQDVPGAGAAFVVTLEVPTVAELQAQSSPLPLALLADGDAIHRAMTLALLERLGYRVETVNEGVAAVMFVMEHRPALVVLDMALPVLDGLEVARRLRVADVSMPIVGFDRVLTDALHAEAATVGVSLVAKPVAPLLFQRALRQASGSPRSAPSRRSVESEAEDPSGERTRLDANRQMDEALRAMIAAVELHGRALDAAIAKQDLGVAAEVTRALRAAVIALNARGLEAVLRDLEQAARAGDAEECRRAHRTWHTALASLRESVERFLGRQARSS